MEILYIILAVASLAGLVIWANNDSIEDWDKSIRYEPKGKDNE